MENGKKVLQVRIRALAVDSFFSRSFSFRTFIFAFFFFTAGKKPAYIHYGILRKTKQCDFASKTV